MEKYPRTIYQIALTLNDNHIIVYESDNKECTGYMFQWYLHHEQFFNGVFSIQEAIR